MQVVEGAFSLNTMDRNAYQQTCIGDDGEYLITANLWSTGDHIISTGNNLTIEGSNVVSDEGAALQAGQNITIAAATDTHITLLASQGKGHANLPP